MLNDGGYTNVFYVQRPGSSLTASGLYENPEAPLDPNFRKADSGWQYVERTGELDQVIELLNKKKEDGTLEEYVKREVSKLHQIVGHSTILFAQKSQSQSSG